MFSLRSYTDRMEAEIAKSKLAAGGIPAFLQTGDIGGMRPGPFAYQANSILVVREEDVARARELLNDVEDERRL